MKADFSEFIKTVKAKNDIVEVVGSYVKLERKGYNYWDLYTVSTPYGKS